jgi:alpha-glucosidase
MQRASLSRFYLFIIHQTIKKNSSMKQLLLLFALLSAWQLSATAKVRLNETRLSSPDGRQVFTFYQQTNLRGATELLYRIDFDNQPVIRESKLDISLDNHLWELALAKHWQQPAYWTEGMTLDSVGRHTCRETWRPLYGERSSVDDHYNALTLYLSRHDASRYHLNIEVRAYDAGIAFRYAFPLSAKGDFDAIYHKVTGEQTEFALPDGATAWWTQWAQAPYEEKPLYGWTDNSERPLTLRLSDTLYVCLTEAAQTDYPLMSYAISKTKPSALQTSLYGGGDYVTPFATPWRVVMAAPRLGALLEHNDLLLNLNPANRLADTDWIRPGKIMRSTRLTTDNAKACIDFCAAHGMQYILFDAGWYGNVLDFASDAGVVTAPQLNMPEVVAYGKERGIGTWLYVNQQALQTQADRLFPLYRQWGIVGLKFGFVQFKTQGWATWLHDLVRRAADNHLMVNIHDEYRPTGFERTYPNLLTQEGIRGNEEFPDATHNTILPFTRMIAGAADYTVCYFDPRLRNTHAHQLALPVIFYSPLQTLYWYDTPARIVETPELAFFNQVPVTWDETRVVHDRIGEYVTIARRSGADWYVGCIGNNDARTLTIPLSFLTQGEKYSATLYTTDPKSASPTRVKVDTKRVTADTELTIRLQERDGCAIRITPTGK